MKTTVYVGTSLDGFLARSDGDIGWLVQFEGHVKDDFAEFTKTIDAIVIGRGTYETVLAFPVWPYDKKVFVLTNSVKQVPDALETKVALLSMKPKEVLGHLSRLGYSSIYVDGGNVIQSFLREDCIDELVITRVPVLIGGGISLFGLLQNDLLFEHIQTKVLANVLVQSRYRRTRA